MSNTKVTEEYDLCPECKALGDRFGTPKYGNAVASIFNRDSLRRDCISCRTISRYLRSEKFVVELLGLPNFEERQSESSFKSAELWARYTNALPLRLITIWYMFEPMQYHTFIPEEYLIPRFERHGAADLVRAKQWLKTCRTRHDSDIAGRPTCIVQPIKMKTPLRIIDCITLRIRELMPGESYACLSYVWGNTSPAKVSIGSKIDLGSTSKTISDAIHVAERLGIPRLWVDQYCIDQEESTARQEVIASMNFIYGSSEVTIIAACGTDASYGLSGIQGTKRADQAPTPVVLTNRKLVEEPIRRDVLQSRWNSRGWTFQEALLSSRLLIFTDTQMYFQCPKTSYLDCYKADSPRNGSPVFPEIGPGNCSTPIFDLITEYFNRQLSFAKDGLSAVEGVLEACGTGRSEKYQIKHFYGTPLLCHTAGDTKKRFFSAMGLIWWISDQNPDARIGRYLDAHDSGLPSWTWASQKLASPSPTRTLKFGEGYTSCGSFKDLKCHITSRKGETIDVLHFITASPSQHYSKFHPWIDVTSWTVQSHLTMSDTNYSEGPIFAGIMNAVFRFDNGVSREDEELTAVFMGSDLSWPSGFRSNMCFYFLLTRSAAPGTFYRVGLWFLAITSWPFSVDEETRAIDSNPDSFAEDPQKFLEPYGLSQDAVVEKKTVRII